jgi:hypothetical protein
MTIPDNGLAPTPTTTGTVSHSCKFPLLMSRIQTLTKNRFALCFLASLVILLFVDTEKGRAQAVAYSLEKRGESAETRRAQAAAIIGDKSI